MTDEEEQFLEEQKAEQENYKRQLIRLTDIQLIMGGLAGLIMHSPFGLTPEGKAFCDQLWRRTFR